MEAAKFLIRNMPAHFSYRSDDILKYYALAEEVLASDLSPELQRDSLRDFCNHNIPNLDRYTIPDVRIIKADYLIHNIDMAFFDWKNRPWAKLLDFNDFCEWILPYKAVDYQQLDYWRDTLRTYFYDATYSMLPDDEEYNTCTKTLNYIRQEIADKVKPYYYGMFSRSGYPLLAASLLPKQTFGWWDDYSTLGVLTYRACGLPAVIDQVPCWGRYRDGHTWYTVLDNRGQEIPTEWAIVSQSSKQFFPYQRIPKIYRNSYAYNERIVEYRTCSKYKYPFPLCWQDVTDHYTKTANVEIPIGEGRQTGNRIRLKDKYAYIAVFNGRAIDWQIIDFGEIKHGKAKFNNIGRNILYIALGFNGRVLIPISEPFIVEQDGNIRYISNSGTDFRSVDIRRKYYQSADVAMMHHRIVGAQIQFADKPDFSDAFTAYTIDSSYLPDKITLDEQLGPHRYWRYIGADGSHGSVAELAFFDADTVAMSGTVIGCMASTNDTKVYAFDGNNYTNFESENPDGAWVGKDFGKAVQVKYVHIVPCSDNNDIYPGYEYELKYWSSQNGTWISLGLKIADCNSLHYDDVPKGALMWLSCRTSGIDERPFLINSSGNIEWW